MGWGDIVYSIVQDSKGVFWFGINQGVSRCDGKAWHIIDSKSGLVDDNVYALAADANGDIWAGAKRGVARIS